MQYEIFTPYQRMPAYLCNITEPLNNFFPFGRVVYYDPYAYAHIILSYIEYCIFYTNYSEYSDMIMQNLLNLIPFPEFSYAIYNKNVAALDILSTNENFMKCLKYIGDFYSQEYVNSGQDQQYSLLIYFIYILSNSLKQKFFVFSCDNNTQLNYFEIPQDQCKYYLYLFIQRGSNNFVIFYPIQCLNHSYMVSRLLKKTDINDTINNIVVKLPESVSNRIQNPQNYSNKKADLENNMHQIKNKITNIRGEEAKCSKCGSSFDFENLVKSENKHYCFECAIKKYQKLLDKANGDVLKLKKKFTTAENNKGNKFTKLACCKLKIKSRLVLNKGKMFVHHECHLKKN